MPFNYACDSQNLEIVFENKGKNGAREQASALKEFGTIILKDRNISTHISEKILINGAYWQGGNSITSLNEQLRKIKPPWRYELSGPRVSGTIGGVTYELAKYLLKGHNKEKNYKGKAYKVWALKDNDNKNYFWHENGFSEEEIKANSISPTFYYHVNYDIMLSYYGLRTDDIEYILSKFAILLREEKINDFPLSFNLSNLEKYQENKYWKSTVPIDKKYIKAALSELYEPGSMQKKVIECKYLQHNQSLPATLMKFNNIDESIIIWVLRVFLKMDIALVIKNTLPLKYPLSDYISEYFLGDENDSLMGVENEIMERNFLVDSQLLEDIDYILKDTQ